MLTGWKTPSLDAVFDDMLRTAFGGSTRVSAFVPQVDVRSDDDGIQFELDVPGMKEDELHVRIDNGVLTVAGERKWRGRRGCSDGEQVLVGRSYGAFSHSFKLPDYLDVELLQASLDGGVLTLTIPKSASARPRKIPVMGGKAESKQLTQATKNGDDEDEK